MIERWCANCESFPLPLSGPHCRKCVMTIGNRPLWKQKENKKREEKESKKVIIKKEKRVVGWLENQILEFLKVEAEGGTNAKKSPVIQEKFGIKGKDVRSIVNTLRRSGFAICSDGRGYFYAQTVHDTVATVRQMKSRIANIQAAITGMESNVF